MHILGAGTPIFVRTGSAIVALDKALPLVSSYRLSIVTMPLTEAVWPQCPMGVQSVPPFGGMWGLYSRPIIIIIFV